MTITIKTVDGYTHHFEARRFTISTPQDMRPDIMELTVRDHTGLIIDHWKRPRAAEYKRNYKPVNIPEEPAD